MENKSVTRTDLLTVHLSEFHCISNVEIKQIVIPPAGKAEYHLHPCPVIGHVVSGKLLFQEEGSLPKILHAG
ncbi:hypothetical protein I1300191J6_25320 [Parabacteroides distasonis]|jgi:quercetin dioxygenase-like cupin family protein|uniref:hypothetical protein n=1 Tax=Parabacteroides distasonis TaxID=823 RepID=UPI0034ABD24C